VKYTRRQVSDGIEEVLRGAGLASPEPGPNQPYPKDATAIFRKFQGDKPDRAITINVYDVERAALPLMSAVALVQIKTRVAKGDPNEVDDLADAIVNLLHGVHHASWGEVKVERCAYSFGGSLGADSSGRQERADNFRIVLQ
jgi:hypothetical protein